MKPISKTFTALSVAATMTLIGTVASAGGERITYQQNGVTWSTSNNISVFASRTRDRAFSEHRHAGHFGSPTHGNYGREGVYNKKVHDALNANNRRSKTRVNLGRK